MTFILQRSLIGQNDIARTVDNIKESPGVAKFSEFLKENNLFDRDAIFELAQVLKVPCEQLMKLAKEDKEDKEGYISGDAINNIKHYLDVRVCKKSIEFLQTQSGESGTLNNK